jgi:hypothetical protein
MDIPTFETKKELFAFLVKNRETLIAQKKAAIKHSDAIVCTPELITSKQSVIKEDGEDGRKPSDCVVKVVINTTNILDSHMDVHLKGIWTKSIQENKNILHLQEHELSFENIIADGKDLKAYVSTVSWADLGFPFTGTTEALIFESTVKADRNEFMAEQYRKGYVRNHSVGMQYVKMIMCINDPDYGAEYEAWQKYYPEVINKEVADERGYFWAVKEAKVIEGSAVPRGSNYATPTLSVTESKYEPEQSTQKEIEPPLKGTQINYEFLINGVKNIKLT